MDTILVSALLWVSAIGCGLMAGVYFAFSTFIMAALGRIDRDSGIAAMTAVNRVILRSPFMPLFFATTLSAAALAVAGALHRDDAGRSAMALGGVVYVLGMFVVTVARNVPLNTALAASEGGGDAAATWTRYLREWTRWNHVRTVASALACALFIAAIAES